MRTPFRALVAAAFALVLPGVAVSEGTTVFRRAATVTLSNGQVIRVLSTRSMRPTSGVSTMVFIGEAGIPVVCTEIEDKTWGVDTLTIADGDRTLVLRYNGEFLRDGMPAPAELRLGSQKVFRWLLKESGEVTSQQRAMQKAVAESPEVFRRDLTTFCILCDAAMSDLMLPTLGIIASGLFAEPLPRVAVQDVRNLAPDDITKIFQANALGFFSSQGDEKSPKTSKE